MAFYEDAIKQRFLAEVLSKKANERKRGWKEGDEGQEDRRGISNMNE